MTHRRRHDRSVPATESVSDPVPVGRGARLRFGTPTRAPRRGALGRQRRVRVAHLLRRAQVAARSRRWLRIELALLFFGLPTAILIARLAGARFPLVPVLLVVCAGTVTLLARDPHFDRRVLATGRGVGREGRRVLAWFAVAAVGLALCTACFWPERLLELPREQPLLWMGVMLGYPLLSVLPQELIYRVYFFHRYADAVGSPRVLFLLSALAFGYVHVLYGAWISVLLTLVGGVLFGVTYLRTRSIWLVSLEHALYGCFLFTVGLGRYFYAAV